MMRRASGQGRLAGVWRGVVLGFAALAVGTAFAADWPMWRGNAARTGISSEPLPENLRLQWMRQYPPLKPAYWQPRQERVQFDLGYEPVALGEMLLVASSRNDSVTALDAATGAEKWRFYADGPVRLAPAAWDGKVYFGSDDGFFLLPGGGNRNAAMENPRRALRAQSAGQRAADFRLAGSRRASRGGGARLFWGGRMAV